MNAKTPDDGTHPANMTADDQKAAMALLDNEDAEAEEQADDGENEPTAEAAPAADEGKPEGATDPEAVAADPAKDDATGDDDKVDRKALNGVLNDLRITRDELKALKASQQAYTALPDARDFKAERAALKEQWDAADLDTDEYNDARDSLVLEEAEHRAAVRFHSMQQQAAKDAATNEWSQSVTGWEKANADFLANPIRRKAVSDLLEAFDTDPNNKMTNEELLAKVQEQAFEAFNWQGAPAALETTEQTPAQARMASSARAAAAASGAPPSLAGGVSTSAMSTKLNLEGAAADPSKYKAAKQAVDTVLGEEA